MNRKTQIVLLMTLCMALLLAWGGLGTVSAQIGVSFNNGDGSLTADMAAGLFPYANWNLTTDPSNTATGLVDSSGAATAASVTWDSSGLYGTNAGTATPDRRMFQGQIWSSGSPATHAVSFTGIPYGSYAALIYVVNDNNGHFPYKWDVNGNLATEVYALHLGGGELQNGVWLRAMGTSLATANIANYVYFPNLSGADVTFNYTNLRGDNNAMICGIQIIPTSLVLVDPLTDDLPLISPAAAQPGVTPEAVQLVWHYRKVL